MAINNPALWNNVESAVFDVFSSEVGDQKGIKCFVGEIPPQAYNCWMFEINGGGEPLDAMFNSDFPGNCGRWRMTAMVKGVFAERANAQYLAGVVRTLVPFNENAIANLFWLRPIGEPVLTRVTVPDRQGKEINCWDVEYPLEVIMKEDGVA